LGVVPISLFLKADKNTHGLIKLKCVYLLQWSPMMTHVLF